MTTVMAAIGWAGAIVYVIGLLILAFATARDGVRQHRRPQHRKAKFSDYVRVVLFCIFWPAVFVWIAKDNL